MGILTLLIFLIYEHGVSFHFLVSFSISFNNVLQFSMYRSLTSVVKFIPMYFILFVVIVNGIVFLIYFSASLSSVYRNEQIFLY